MVDNPPFHFQPPFPEPALSRLPSPVDETSTTNDDRTELKESVSHKFNTSGVPFQTTNGISSMAPQPPIPRLSANTARSSGTAAGPIGAKDTDLFHTAQSLALGSSDATNVLPPQSVSHLSDVSNICVEEKFLHSGIRESGRRGHDKTSSALEDTPRSSASFLHKASVEPQYNFQPVVRMLKPLGSGQTANGQFHDQFHAAPSTVQIAAAANGGIAENAPPLEHDVQEDSARCHEPLDSLYQTMTNDEQLFQTGKEHAISVPVSAAPSPHPMPSLVPDKHQGVKLHGRKPYAAATASSHKRVRRPSVGRAGTVPVTTTSTQIQLASARDLHNNFGNTVDNNNNNSTAQYGSRGTGSSRIGRNLPFDTKQSQNSNMKHSQQRNKRAQSLHRPEMMSRQARNEQLAAAARARAAAKHRTMLEQEEALMMQEELLSLRASTQNSGAHGRSNNRRSPLDTHVENNIWTSSNFDSNPRVEKGLVQHARQKGLYNSSRLNNPIRQSLGGQSAVSSIQGFPDRMRMLDTTNPSGDVVGDDTLFERNGRQREREQQIVRQSQSRAESQPAYGQAPRGSVLTPSTVTGSPVGLLKEQDRLAHTLLNKNGQGGSRTVQQLEIAHSKDIVCGTAVDSGDAANAKKTLNPLSIISLDRPFK